MSHTPLRFVMVGGGSGGHITPLFAVAHQLKTLQPDCTVIYIGQTGDSLADIPASEPSIDQVFSVRAGKLRRYHGEGWRQLLDVPTVAKNIRDIGYVLAGLVQSYVLLRRLRPDAIFVKGGFVGVPVGLAAAALGIPYVTHDSDALPGLANRIIARWARLHTVALPKEVYAYPAAKTMTVGVPIGHDFRLRSAGELAAIRQELMVPQTAKLILVTGGGLGAQRINDAVLAIASSVLDHDSETIIVHVAGRLHEQDIAEKYKNLLKETDRSRVKVVGFIGNLYAYAAVASVVISRAGGNSIAEFAALGKACIVVPNPVLTGGHQSKNAQVLADAKAVVVVTESELQRRPEALYEPLIRLLDKPQEAAQLGKRLQTLAMPDAAKRLAVVLLDIVTVTSPAPKETPTNNHDIQSTQS